ncbi:MAG: hypothetical protein WED07_12265 [Candidatus Freyarchaeum deiterrae]
MNVSKDSKVYLFVFTGMTPLNSDLQQALEQWSKEAEGNLFVGIWPKSDTDYQKVVSQFSIDKSPTILITAKPELALMDDLTEENVWVKIDNEKILHNKNYIEQAKKILEHVYYLFLSGKIKEAVKSVKKSSDKAKVITAIYGLKDTLGGTVGKWLNDHNLKVAWGSFKLDIEHSKNV